MHAYFWLHVSSLMQLRIETLHEYKTYKNMCRTYILKSKNYYKNGIKHSLHLCQIDSILTLRVNSFLYIFLYKEKEWRGAVVRNIKPKPGYWLKYGSYRKKYCSFSTDNTMHFICNVMRMKSMLQWMPKLKVRD